MLIGTYGDSWKCSLSKREKFPASHPSHSILQSPLLVDRERSSLMGLSLMSVIMISPPYEEMSRLNTFFPGGNHNGIIRSE